MLLQAALNGNRHQQEHAAIPVTLEHIVQDAQRTVRAGAGALHVHVRDRDGQESLGAEDVRQTVTALRQACPNTPIGISTGAWIVPDADQRLLLIKQWDVLPDFVSLNFDEDGAVTIVHLLRSKAIGIEAGIANDAACTIFVQSQLVDACVRVLIEPEENTLAAARATVHVIEHGLDQAAIRLPRLLHGLDLTAWDILKDAIARGYDTRMGFEDTLTLPDGALAESNAALVAAACQLIDA